ncbi:hypothetical protein Q5752_002108 [Cryptotrichosporon argae]
MDVHALGQALRQAPNAVVDSDELCLASAAVYEGAARYIATHLNERDEILAALAEHTSTSPFTHLGRLWSALAAALDPAHAGPEDSRVELAAALAKLERNMVAGVQANQEAAIAHEADVRRLIFNVTTFARIEDARRFFTLQNVLVQLLSNLISPVDDGRIADAYLRLYLSGKREDDVIIRLWDSRDAKVNLATLHLLSNLTRDPARMQLLLCEPTGLRWLSALLGRMDELHHRADADGRFDLLTSLVARIIAHDQHGALFAALSDGEEPITPSQTTLLKVLDSYLAAPHAQADNAFLVPAFRRLVDYAVPSMKHVPDDARLPKVFEAVVLVAEALSSVGLAAQARADRRRHGEAESGPGKDDELVAAMKAECGLIEPLIHLLAGLDAFLPRIKPFHPDPNRPAPAPQPGPVLTDPRLPFANIKRDLVRLLGVLAFEDVAVGDRVREAGGVELVLGMCETDERNAFLREHALFAVRNLMWRNPANQAVIAQMDPVGIVGENGELQPLPARMRQKKNAEAGAGETGEAADGA